jgi:hypothetical protein
MVRWDERFSSGIVGHVGFLFCDRLIVEFQGTQHNQRDQSRRPRSVEYARLKGHRQRRQRFLHRHCSPC